MKESGCRGDEWRKSVSGDNRAASVSVSRCWALLPRAGVAHVVDDGGERTKDVFDATCDDDGGVKGEEREHATDRRKERHKSRPLSDL